ncbi:hypothetical protein BSZ22_29800 [Bradyrhizobium canariense]|uniref:Uncharacterized protein n=1 Tax=Bradyrhizobium canariense TaxID=255045 RepID=A0A1X3H1B4_9BRAD|nr:hypothetical protein BSZ21_24720 [Bradyrhizobium canariense]OSI65916.1 hypothetical protein BSZ22_29800 [Bradyrhizobium canariense]OSI76367.1 hypothetical protein BSZ23_26345 [Bradyrhizobium canariense]OSI87479.1 hypothetical protein BSZ25_25940 [Bradyrhizobium canariense]OSI97808.1 hypothetical protein BSZ24_02130 [Bradyrhizobium canariense]
MSCPAKAGHPVRRGASVQAQRSLEYWIVRPCAQLRTRRTMTDEFEEASRNYNTLAPSCWKPR